MLAPRLDIGEARQGRSSEAHRLESYPGPVAPTSPDLIVAAQPERQPALSSPAVPTLGERAVRFVVASDVEHVLEHGAPPPRRQRQRP
ncbi:MAG: hypothetical protein K0S35_1439 [Geminicoccaceae bacterium]|nr:hypothetical protein [Geminicoccaceae bacterium]